MGTGSDLWLDTTQFIHLACDRHAVQPSPGENHGAESTWAMASSGTADQVPGVPYNTATIYARGKFSIPYQFLENIPKEGYSSSPRKKSVIASYVLFTSSMFVPCMRKVPSEVWRWTFQRGKLVSRQDFKAKEYSAGFILWQFLINCSSLLYLDHSIGSFV